MAKRPDTVLTVNATGVQVSSGAASAVVAIPNDASGNRARIVRIAIGAGVAYVRPGIVSTTATVNDIAVVVSDYLLLNVQGFTHIAYIQETSAQKLNITPVEDC
jgi:hypothetical protein